MKKQILEIDDLTLGYNKILYQSISAYALESELIALIGPNGTGKSTLLKSIAGMQPTKSGRIKIYTKNIQELNHRELSKYLAFVPSFSPRAHNFTLFDMVATSCYNRTNWYGGISEQEKSYIVYILEKIGLLDFIDSDSSKLSDGEYQRAAIARSLVQNSPIILLDEPTAFLDIANKSLITQLLRDIAHNDGKSILFSTHDLPLAIQMCDKIWIMGHNGFLTGSPQELIEKGAFDTMFKDSNLKFDQKLLTLL